MVSELLFWAMISAFLTHELDAIKRHEWRVLPLIRSLPEKPAEQCFIWLHLPLCLALFWFAREGADTLFAKGFSLFAVIHVLLHWLFRKHPAYEFNNVSSWLIILVTGILGAAHLVLTL